ncbi:hypothetical protein D3C80_1712430 [compost metagenome]
MLEGVFRNGIWQPAVVYVEPRRDRRHTWRCGYAAAGVPEDIHITPGLDRPVEGQHLFGEQICAPAGVEIENKQHCRLILAFISNIEPGANLHSVHPL